MSKLTKVLLLIGGILLVGVAIEGFILFRSGNLSSIIPPKQTTTVGQNKLVFETASDIPGVSFGISDQSALETFLNDRGPLKFFEETGAYQLGSTSTSPIKKIIIKITSEKQDYMKMLTKDNSGKDVELQSIGSDYDSQNQIYTLKVYCNTDFIKNDPNFDSKAFTQTFNVYVLQSLFVISQAKAGFNIQEVLTQISSEINQKNILVFSVKI